LTRASEATSSQEVGPSSVIEDVCTDDGARDLDGVALIVQRKTGVWYGNQVGRNVPLAE